MENGFEQFVAFVGMTRGKTTFQLFQSLHPEGNIMTKLRADANQKSVPPHGYEQRNALWSQPENILWCPFDYSISLSTSE